MTRPLAGLIISAVAVLRRKCRQHHGGDLLRRIICVKGSPRVRGAYQAIVVVRGQQHELALAMSSDLDRATKGGFYHLARAIAEIRQRKMGHENSLRSILPILADLAHLPMLVNVPARRSRSRARDARFRPPAVPPARARDRSTWRRSRARHRWRARPAARAASDAGVSRRRRADRAGDRGGGLQVALPPTSPPHP